MIRLFVLLSAFSFLLACAKSGDDTPGGALDPRPEEKTFSGRLESFRVEFGSLFGSKQNQDRLMYSLRLRSSSVGKGYFNIYDCRDSSCAVKYLLYRATCNFDALVCDLTDSQGAPIDHAADFARFETLRCDSDECSYLTLVDPRSLSGTFDQYFAAEFVPAKGEKTEMLSYHLARTR